VPPPEWQLESLGDTGLIEDLTLVSANLGFATSGSRVLRWDGRSWVAYGEPGYDAAGTSLVHGVAADATTVVAVGEDGLVATRPVDGGEWERLASLQLEKNLADLWDPARRRQRVHARLEEGHRAHMIELLGADLVARIDALVEAVDASAARSEAAGYLVQRLGLTRET
jgi:hypothetical protein